MRNNILQFPLSVLCFLLLTEGFYCQDSIKILENDISLQDTILAADYFQTGESFIKSAQYDSSIFYFGMAKDIYEKLSERYGSDNTWEGIVKCSNKIGWNLMRLAKYDEAIEILMYSLKTGLQKLRENHPDVAAGFINTGLAYSYKNDFLKALENCEKALAIRVKLYGDKHRLVAASYANIGIVYTRNGDYDKAIENQKLSLSIGLNTSGENHNDVANNYYNLGNLYWYKRDYDKSLEMYRKSLSIKGKILGNEHPDIGKCYNNIGIIAYEKGDYDLALESYQKSLTIWLIPGENNPDAATGYYNLGMVYMARLENSKALEFYGKSLSILLQLFGEVHSAVGSNYDNMATVYADNGDYVEAEKFYKKSIAIKLQLGEKNPNNNVVYSYQNLGKLYAKIGKKELSLDYYFKALELGIEIFGNHYPVIGEIYKNLADVYYEESDFETALSYCNKSINSLVKEFSEEYVFNHPPLDEINNELQLLNTIKLKAKIFSALSEKTGKKDLEMSLSSYLFAVELIDKLRTGYRSEGSKLFLGENVSEIFEDAIHTSYKLYELTKEESYKDTMFLFAEKSKANVLQDELAEVHARQFSGLPQQLLDTERQLRTDLSFYETQLQNEYQNRDKPDSDKILKYENRLFDLKVAYEELISDFENNYPDYYDLKYQTRAVSIREIREQIAANLILVDYFVGDSIIYIFTVTKENFDIHSIKKGVDFTRLVKDFYSSVVKSETGKYLTSASKLSELLILPIKNNITSKDKMVIIPHDILYKIPFEALLSETVSSSDTYSKINYSQLDYLIKSFNISYHYSANLYIRSLKQEGKLPADNNDDKKNFIGFAPVFTRDDLTGYTLAGEDLTLLVSDSDELLHSFSSDGKSFNELIHSEWEVKSIVELFAAGGSNISKGYFYSSATEGVFKRDIKNYEIVHIATHSFMNEVRPGLSGVVFAQYTDSPGRMNSEDGILYAGEIYNLNLNAELVVLSSCESGLGKLIRGEGMMALTRGFLYSGARNIIFSLWKIPDKHTSELMIEFYKNIFMGKNYSESLRQAKLTLIKNELTARPRSWAGFIMIGALQD